jgi:MraZ protein
MLIGEYHHTLDAKKRLALPAKFRKELGRKVIITHGFDNCLFVYPQKEWEAVAAHLAGLSIGQADNRRISRFMLSGAIEAEIDKAGRVLLPDFLKNFSGIKQKVVVAGVYTRVEIWDEDRWDSHSADTRKQADVLAEQLGHVGKL